MEMGLGDTLSALIHISQLTTVYTEIAGKNWSRYIFLVFPLFVKRSSEKNMARSDHQDGVFEVRAVGHRIEKVLPDLREGLF